MVNKKEILLSEIEKARFAVVSEDTFNLYDEFKAMHDPVKDCRMLSDLEFYRGEAYFRLGQYGKSQEIINDCLLHHQEPVPPELNANCHNVLGLIYSAMGYQMVALENYLSGLDASIRAGDSRQKTVIQINMGWLYRDLGDYDKALFYYYQALKEFQYTDENDFYSLRLLCYAYIGQIYFKTARYDEALSMLDIIEKLSPDDSDDFFYSCISNLRIRAYHFLGDKENLDIAIDAVLLNSATTTDFLEYSADYLDICTYLLEFCEPRSRLLIDTLQRNAEKISCPFLLLNIQKLQIAYSKKYDTKDAYLSACGDYVLLQQEFDKLNCEMKLNSLNNIEVLRKVQKECQLYLEQSKLDLMTGILNKVSFEQTVETLLQKKSTLTAKYFALAIIDLDHFKQINDHFGHIEGDKALLEIVNFMSIAFGETAILGRIGGDEFGIFWPFIDSIDHVYTEFATMQREFICHCKSSDQLACNASISAGIIFSNRHALPYKELFQRTDNELYNAKAQGRGTICFNTY